MALIRPKSYQVLITPLVSKGVYGTTLDVTQDIEIDDYVKDSGISSIKSEVDNGDFDFGVFVFDSINLTCLNNNGRFTDSNDYRSMFKYKRDKAKIKINFFDGTSNTAALTFNGIIDDRATKLNFEKNEIKFKVLSMDSIINRVKITSGTVTDGQTTTTAIKNILQLTDIIEVLEYVEANITPQLEHTIDVGSYFDNKTVKEGLDELLIATNSVLVVDKSTAEMTVRSRNFNNGNVVNLYGHGDLFGRENIINIKNYNTGLQRAFNTVVVGDIARSNLGYIEAYGDNKKTLAFEWITNPATQANMATQILDYWKTPKTELEVQVETSLANEMNFFDLVSIDFPYRVKPANGGKLPIYGVSKYGTAIYPFIFGNLKISPNVAFKVIGKKENPKTFLTDVKLRQSGQDISDGYLSVISSYYGFALYGIDVYTSDPSRLDPNRKSVFGAAKYGTVIYGL